MATKGYKIGAISKGHASTFRGKDWVGYLERVWEVYQRDDGSGDIANRDFWIAYPLHVGPYGAMTDRTSRADCRGEPRREAFDRFVEGRQ